MNFYIDMKVPTSVRLDEDEARLLSKFSRDLGLSRTEAIHRAIKLFLTIKTVNLISLLSPIVGYLEALNHLISSHKKQVEGLPENHLIFNAISEWMNIYDKHYSLFTSILKATPYPYENIVNADKQITLRRASLNNLFFTEELKLPSYHMLLIESLKSLVKQEETARLDDRIIFYNRYKRLSRYIDFLEALERDINQLIDKVSRSRMQVKEMGFRDLASYLDALNSDLERYRDLIGDLIDQSTCILVTECINFLNHCYVFSSGIIKKLVEKPLKPNEVRRIAGKYEYEEKDLFYFLNDLSTFGIATYDKEESIYKISKKALACIKKILPIS